MDTAHWTRVWEGRDPDSVTWFQEHPEQSVRLIREVSSPTDGVIDVGGGASRLVDHLLADGYTDLTVLDIAEPALAAARCRLGAAAQQVDWKVVDVTDAELGRTFDVWHDRAVFHFLVEAADRERYVAALSTALPAGAHLVLATFGPEGPEQCSGLPVRRYDVDTMCAALGDEFEPLTYELESHVSPTGITQQFLYAVFRRAR